MTPMDRDRAAAATTAGKAVAMIVVVMVLAIMMLIVLVMLISMLWSAVAVDRVIVAAAERILQDAPANQYKRNQKILTDQDRAKLRSGWMSPSSAAPIASRYVVRASPSLTRLAEPHVNADRPSFIAIMSAIRRACLPLRFGNA